MADKDPIEELLDEESIRDPKISDIFYFFERLTSLDTGRTIGRKIGVVQEVLLRKYLEGDAQASRRLFLEQKLMGRSGATHKVEFSWFSIRPTGPLKKGSEILPGLRVNAVDDEARKIRVEGDWVGGRTVAIALDEPTPRSAPLRPFLDAQNLDVRLTDVQDGAAFFDVVDKADLLASLESKRVGAQRFRGSSKLGSGIQTIEKAKQASLVAIDLDLKHNRSVKPLEGSEEKRLLSFAALGNGVHWSEKDKAVLGTYVDYTFLVRDSGIIRYAEHVQDLLGDEDDFLEAFMDYFKGMTKQEPDEFVVGDDDFEIIVPNDEARPLRSILGEHLERVNPL